MKLPYSKIKQYAPKPPHGYQPPFLEDWQALVDETPNLIWEDYQSE